MILPTAWLICLTHFNASSCEISLCKRKKKIGFSRIFEFIEVHWYLDAVEKSWLILRVICILYHMRCCLLARVWNNHYYNFTVASFKKITEIYMLLQILQWSIKCSENISEDEVSENFQIVYFLNSIIYIYFERSILFWGDFYLLKIFWDEKNIIFLENTNFK